MLTLTFLRHGETDWNAQRRCQGQHDVPLNATGMAQAKAAANRLAGGPVDAVYSSDLSRAHVTAEHVAAPHGIHVKPDARLRELDHGVVEGLSIDEAHQKYPAQTARWLVDPSTSAWPNGETMQQLQTRTLACLDELKTHERGHVVVVSHYMALRTIITQCLGMPLENFRRFVLDTASISRVEIRELQVPPVLHTLNNTTHLSCK